MGQAIIVVTGLPGAGKTTLAEQLVHRLQTPLFSLDAVKESLFASLEVTDRHLLRGACLDLIAALLRASPTGGVVDIWVDPTRDLGSVRRHLENSGIQRRVEVQCVVSGELAAQRFAARPRAGPHRPVDEQLLHRIREAAALLQPLGIGPSLQVDTSDGVDLAPILTWVREELGTAEVS